MTAARSTLIPLIVAWGVAWAIVTYIHRQGPHYGNAVTALDFAAVWSYSVALALSALMAWVVAWFIRTHLPAAGLAIVVGAGLFLAAVANAIEDGLGLKPAGSIYVISAVVGLYGSIVLAIALTVARAPVLAAVAVAPAVGVLFLASLGGYVVLALSLWLSARLIRRPEGLAPDSRVARQEVPASPAAP